MQPVRLTQGDIVLRPWAPDDVRGGFEAVRESEQDLLPWMPWARDYSLQKSADWVRHCQEAWSSGKEYNFVITDARDGDITGGCGLNHIDPPNRGAALGYWVRSSRTRRGLATTAARLAAGFGFRELGLVRIEIVVAVGNSKSLRVAEKTGATREGTLRNRIVFAVDGSVGDAALFSLIPGDLEGARRQPSPV